MKLLSDPNNVVVGILVVAALSIFFVHSWLYVEVETGQYWIHREYKNPFDNSPREVRRVIDVNDGYVLYKTKRPGWGNSSHTTSSSVESFKIGMELSDANYWKE